MSPVLGIDFGRARVGVAISDELQLLAHPLETISTKQNPLKRIAQIVDERRIEKVIVGLPRQMSGELGKAAADANQFVERLRKELPCEVITWDERLTTVAAHRTLRETGRRTRQTRAYIDQVAAQMILQGYLDRQRESATPSQATAPS